VPTRQYKDIAEVYQTLTDEEMTGEVLKPFSVIPVKGLGKIKIRSVSVWDYFHTLVPMRNELFNIYAEALSSSSNVESNEKLLDRMRSIVNDIGAIKTKEELEKKAETLSILFTLEKSRKCFYKGLKKLRILPFFTSFLKYEKRIERIQEITIFILLWSVNFDGVKKNAKLLIDTISRAMKSDSYIDLNSYGDWDSYKKRLQEASLRNRNLQMSSVNSKN
jgi:hypothetical protein